MKKSLKVFLVYTILTLMDGALTLYNTPNLSLEANPLITKLHLGWGALIIANIIGLAIVYFSCYYTFDVYKTIKVDVPNLRSYMSQMFYNRPDKFVWTFYKLPKNWKPFWAWLLYPVGYAMCTARLVLVLEWIAHTFKINISWYNQLRHLCFERFDVAIAVILIILLIFIWPIKEYKKSKYV